MVAGLVLGGALLAIPIAIFWAVGCCACCWSEIKRCGHGCKLFLAGLIATIGVLIAVLHLFWLAVPSPAKA